MKNRCAGLILFVFLMVGMMAFSPAVAYGEEGGISVEAECGYEGIAKGGRYVPVKIRLENSGTNDFYGQLHMKSMESDGEIYEYQYEVSVDSEAADTFLYYVPLGSGSNQIFVSLFDEEGQEMGQKRLKLNVSLDMPELFVGILSDTPDKLQYFNGIGINYSMIRTKTFTMTTEGFPEEEIGLDMLDVLVVSNYNLRQLNEAQSRAIMDWVRNGGVLMLGTGERVAETLGRYAPELLESSYGTPESRWINMGLDYALEGPGDSRLELMCVDVPLQGGNIVFADEGFPLLTSVTREKGMVVVAAYDFCDIAQFCQNQPSYVDEMFTSLLGEERISELSNYIYGSSNEYWSVQSMLNTGNVNRLPNIPLYVLVIAVYILLIGPGLYIFLKRKNKQQYFRNSVVVLALCFTAIIWLMGSKTRFVSTFFTYATVRDVSEDMVTETSYINMRNPYSRTHSVELNPDYSVRPVTYNTYYDMTSLPVFTGKEAHQVGIEARADRIVIQVEDATAFESRLFCLERSRENTAKEGITGNVTCFDGKLSGQITNQFHDALENVAVLLFGKIALVGDMEPGETKDLADVQVLNVPIGETYLSARWITGNNKYEAADIDDAEYLLSMEQANLLSFYMSDYLSGYYTEGRVVSFSTKQSENKFFLEEGDHETYGMTMLTSAIPVNYRDGSLQYRQALMKAPNVISGSYQGGANAMIGIDPLILEYSLGNELEIQKLTFEKISPEFLEESRASYVTEFSGNIYFYNYNTGNYDLVDMGDGVFTAGELCPYLSPGNTVTVKYSNMGTSGYNWIYLPMLSVVGREK